MTEGNMRRLGRIAGVLARRRVKFVVIGGWAAQAQDYDLGYETEDIDITPEMELENLERLSAALNDLQARLLIDGEAFVFDHNADYLKRVVIQNLTCEYGRFDLVFEPRAMGGYENLIRSAHKIVIDADGAQVEIWCADIDDIMRSKAAADRPKDRPSVELLRAQIETKRVRLNEPRSTRRPHVGA